MGALDKWLAPERLDRVRLVLVDPVSFKPIGRELPCTGGTVDDSYDSDTRISASAQTVDFDKYVDLAAVRVVHESEWPSGRTESEVLGTFYVTDTPGDWESGSNPVTFDLRSSLWAVSVDKPMGPYTIAKDATAENVFDDVCRRCHRASRKAPGYVPYRHQEPIVLDASTSYLEILEQGSGAQEKGNRLEVDPDGKIALTKYIDPHSKGADYRLAWDSSFVLSSAVSRKSNELQTAGRSVVTWDYSYEVEVQDGEYERDYTDSEGNQHQKGDPKYKKTTEHKTVAGGADVNPSDRASIKRRGFRVAVEHSLQDMETDSVSEAQERARAYLKDDSKPTTTWSFETRWIGAKAGQIVRFEAPDGTNPKCLVETVRSDLWTFKQQITLREV